MEAFHVTHIVAAVIENGGDVMLVHQQVPDDPESSWSLPGGRVETGESLIEALKREVLEETGLTLNETSPTLLYVCEVVDADAQSVVFVFRVSVESEVEPVSDPDGHILEARFVPLDGAVTLLSQHRYLPMCEAPASCLRGEGVTFWSYCVSPRGEIVRVIPV